MSGNVYGIFSGTAASVVADSNLIEDNARGNRPELHQSSALLTNNIIVRSTDSEIGYGVVVEYGSSARIINNTIYQNALQGVVLQQQAGPRLMWPIPSSTEMGAAILRGIPSGSIVNDLTASDPKFNNPSSNDFSLQAGSPAIDKGTNSVQGLPFLDYSGRLRVASATGAGQGTVDIGADGSKFVIPAGVSACCERQSAESWRVIHHRHRPVESQQFVRAS